jgi:hypothetical protein
MSKLHKQILETADRKYLDKFWSFIYERHSIWYRRFILKQPAPWTDDQLLREYKFTNVYRELDRGTIYLLDNIRGHGEPIDQVWNIIVYRMFNRISTYELLTFQSVSRWQKPRMFRAFFDELRGYQDAGNALYTDAHLVCAYASFPGKDKLERFEYIFQGVLQGMETLMKIINKAKSLETVHKALSAFPGVGPFLAYEMAVDISYCDWNNLGEDEWVNPGPGCQRGLKAIFPDITPKEYIWRIKELREIQNEEFDRLKLPFRDIAYQEKELTLRNIEHCLCEAFKLFKAMDGTGRPRNKFIQRAEKDNWMKRLKG